MINKWYVDFFDPKTQIGMAVYSDEDGDGLYMVRGDANGKVVEQRLICTGQSYSMSGAVRLRQRVGRLMTRAVA